MGDQLATGASFGRLVRLTSGNQTKQASQWAESDPEMLLASGMKA